MGWDTVWDMGWYGMRGIGTCRGMGWGVGGHGWDMWDVGVWDGAGDGRYGDMGWEGERERGWDVWDMGLWDGMWGHGVGQGMGHVGTHGGGMGWDAGWDRGWDGMRDMGTCGVMGWDVDGMWDVGVRDGAGDGRYGDMGRDRGRDV